MVSANRPKGSKKKYTPFSKGDSMFVEIAVVAAAYVAGTVSPAVGRKIKAFVDKEEVAAKADVSKAEADVKADVKKL